MDTDVQETTEDLPKVTVVLASESPRRKQLLADAGVVFTAHPAKVDESLEPDLAANPPEAAKKLAERKAGAVVQELLATNPSGMFAIIGADTMVVKDNEIYGKPRSLSHATHMLRELSGRTHQVITGVSVWLLSTEALPENANNSRASAETDAYQDEGNISLGFRSFACTSNVTFHKLEDSDIAEYLAKGESFDKAGAYAAQGEGAALIEKIDGDLDNVIGLPVRVLLEQFSFLKE